MVAATGEPRALADADGVTVVTVDQTRNKK